MGASLSLWSVIALSGLPHVRTAVQLPPAPFSGVDQRRPGHAFTAVLDFQARHVRGCPPAQCNGTAAPLPCYLLLPLHKIGAPADVYTATLLPLYQWAVSGAGPCTLVVVPTAAIVFPDWLRDALELLGSPPVLTPAKGPSGPRAARVVYGLPPPPTVTDAAALRGGFRLRVLRGAGLAPVLEPLPHPTVLCVALPCDGLAVPPGADLRTADARTAFRALVALLQVATVAALHSDFAWLTVFLRPHVRVLVACGAGRGAAPHPHTARTAACGGAEVAQALGPYMTAGVLSGIHATRLVEDSRHWVCAPWTRWFHTRTPTPTYVHATRTHAGFGNVMRVVSSAFNFAAVADLGFALTLDNAGVRDALDFNAATPPGRAVPVGGDITSCAGPWVRTASDRYPAAARRLRGLLSQVSPVLRDPSRLIADLPLMGCAYHSVLAPTRQTDEAVRRIRQRLRPGAGAAAVVGVHLRTVAQGVALAFARAMRCVEVVKRRFGLPNATRVLLAADHPPAAADLAKHRDVVLSPPMPSSGNGDFNRVASTHQMGPGGARNDSAIWITAVRDLHLLAESDYFYMAPHSSFSVLAAGIGVMECLRLPAQCGRVCLNVLRSQAYPNATAEDPSVQAGVLPPVQQQQTVCPARFPRADLGRGL